MKVFFGVLLLGFLIAFIAAVQTPVDNQTVLQSIDESCRKEYGGRGEQAVMSCKIELARRELARREGERLERAASGVRH